MKNKCYIPNYMRGKLQKCVFFKSHTTDLFNTRVIRLYNLSEQPQLFTSKKERTNLMALTFIFMPQ